MIKSYTVYTKEVDDAEAAGGEIAHKLANLHLFKNTIGIISVHPEMVTSGVLSRICKLLPFQNVGITSIAHSLNNEVDTYMLSILILTSDDCEFCCEPSNSIGDFDDIKKLTTECYDKCVAKSNLAPKAAFLCAPLFDKPRAGEYIKAIADANKNLPVFGAVANDKTPAYDPQHYARTLFCGDIYKDRFILITVHGAVSPKFYIRTATNDAVAMPNIGVVSAVEKNKILEINNVPALKFLKDVGFLTDDQKSNLNGMISSIFILRHNDSTISRIPVWIDGTAIVCGGYVIEGATLSIAFNTKETVLETAKELTNAIKKENKSGTVLFCSCLGRRFCLLNDPLAELRLLSNALGENFNITALYTNGELCPVVSKDGTYENLDHNQTLAACVF